MAYRKRIIDEVIRQHLRVTGAVLIEGPKWCGKTTTAEQIAESELKLGDPDILKRAKVMILNNNGVRILLDGATPRLFDEWQNIPVLWDAVRSAVDRGRKPGQFILTGSAVPASTQEIHHSGTGRFSWVRMRPMSLFESGDSNGAVSLMSLFKGEPISGNSSLGVQDLAFVTARGGFPESILPKMKHDALLMPRKYLDGIIHSDLSRVDGVQRSPEYIERMLRSYARFQGEQVALTDIQNDMGGVAGTAPNINTVSSYHEALKKIFVVEDLAAWNPNLRSKTAIRTTDTRYFVDPSIAVVALDTDPDGLFEDLNTFGFIFETLCIRDLRVYADALGGKVSHYRDSNGLECDAVVRIPGGRYGLVQLKLGGNEDEINDAAMKMQALAGIIDTKREKAPAFMAVVTGVQSYAYQREDGVYVVPIGCLKP
ncbi:ATP-binding protein [Candidatus Saccharibacteria bacterium]|nr:ATP-binding protein [Candidatus Saccharibacteria bacterium]